MAAQPAKEPRKIIGIHDTSGQLGGLMDAMRQLTGLTKSQYGRLAIVEKLRRDGVKVPASVLAPSPRMGNEPNPRKGVRNSSRDAAGSGPPS